MKLKSSYLKQIIKEEVDNFLATEANALENNDTKGLLMDLKELTDSIQVKSGALDEGVRTELRQLIQTALGIMRTQ